MGNGENGLLMAHAPRHVELEQRPEHEHVTIRLLDMAAKLVLVLARHPRNATLRNAQVGGKTATLLRYIGTQLLYWYRHVIEEMQQEEMHG